MKAEADDGAVAAIVVTYEPDRTALLATLSRTMEQVRRVLVVDNGSANRPSWEADAAALPGVELLPLEDNFGVATALNHGVRHLATSGDHQWVLTLDQDTTLCDRAIETLFAAFGELDEATRRRTGALGLSFPRPSPRAFWRWAERHLILGEVGAFRDRLFLITSGNLIRRSVAESVPYEDDLFIDQVDTAFSVAVRAAGYVLLELAEPQMRHEVGTVVEVRGKRYRYETGNRLYYIVRNATLLMRRRQLPLAVSVALLASWCRAYLYVNGPAALPRELAIIGTAVFDALSGRLGRRQYRFLAEPRGRRAKLTG
ncbi:MAG TPA: glycosyltransferase [Acidimicrobiales bacterium]|nr:glycosyltransferase [Acidimicrobiales bacterium]